MRPDRNRMFAIRFRPRRRPPPPPQATQRSISLRDIRRLGRGGQGDAWLVQDRLDGQYLVAKRTAHLEWTRDGRPKEVDVLSNCLGLHPNVLRLRAWTVERDSRGKKVLETIYNYCDGGALNKWIPRGGDPYLSEARLWHVFKGMARGLAYMHHGYDATRNRWDTTSWHRPVIHRDLSPDNVFLKTHRHSRYHDIVLGDLGYATTSSTTKASMKPAYQDPQCPSITTKTDIWAMGGICTSTAWVPSERMGKESKGKKTDPPGV